MNINLFLNPQYLDYTPSEEEWQEKEDIENYIFSDFEEDIKDFPNFPRHLMNWYHAKEDSIDDDDQRQCLMNCYILAAAETLILYGYSIDSDGIVSADLCFNAVIYFRNAFLINLHEWRHDFM